MVPPMRYVTLVLALSCSAAMAQALPEDSSSETSDYAALAGHADTSTSSQTAAVCEGLKPTSDYYFRTFHCQAFSGQACTTTLHPGARWYVGPAHWFDVTGNAVKLNGASLTLQPNYDIKADIIASTSISTPQIFTSNGGLQETGRNSAPWTCDGTRVGMRYVSNSDGRWYYCDGVTGWRKLDLEDPTATTTFGSPETVVAGTCTSTTVVAVTNATVGRPCTVASPSLLGLLRGTCEVLSAGQASLQFCNSSTADQPRPAGTYRLTQH